MKTFDFVKEINATQKAIDDLEKKLTALKEYKRQLHEEEFDGYTTNLRPYSKPVFDYVDAILTPLIMNKKATKNINVVGQNGKKYDLAKNGYYVMIEPTSMARDCYCYAMGGMTGASKEYCKYKSLKRFKEVINELAASITRGDEEFTFPADDKEAE